MSFLKKFFIGEQFEKHEQQKQQNPNPFDSPIWRSVKQEHGLDRDPVPACPVSSHRDVMWVHDSVLYFAPKKLEDVSQIESYPMETIKQFYINPRNHNEIRLQLQKGCRPQGSGEPLLFRSNSLAHFRTLLPDKEHKFSEKIMQAGTQRATVNSIKLGNLKDVRSGAEFEEYIADLFSILGYAAKNVPLTKDQGIDVLVHRSGMRYGIQAKYYSQSVGNAAVQQAIAGREYYKLDKGVVVTNSTFTPAAVALAKKTNIRLIDGTELNKLIKKAKTGHVKDFSL